jgi:VWA domain-containing protein
MQTGRWLASAMAMVVTVGALSASVVSAQSRQSRQRSMYVSVLDEKGVPVPDLGPTDFVVREDNVAREVLQVTRADDPIHIALLVDTSQAARGSIGDYRLAIPGFIDAVLGGPAGVKNQVAIIGIGERPTILADYTSTRTQLTNAVNRIFAVEGTGTYLLDGIIETSQGLKKREAARSVIVALTTEGPELSDRHYQQVLEPLKASGATLHVIALGRPLNMSEDRSVALSRGTSESGGRYDNLLVPSALPTRLKELAGEIVGQYRVTYARPETLIPPEKITVASNRPKVTTRGIPVNEPSAPVPDRGRQD